MKALPAIGRHHHRYLRAARPRGRPDPGDQGRRRRRQADRADTRSRRLRRSAGRSAGAGVPRCGRRHLRHPHQDGRNGQGRRRPERRGATKAPIVFIGVGEHLEDLDPFIPDTVHLPTAGHGRHPIAAGDGEGEHQRGGGAWRPPRRSCPGKFTLKEMYEQMEMLTNMGPLKKLMSMLPGMRHGGLQDKINVEETQETPATLPHHHGLHDRRGDGGAQAHQVLAHQPHRQGFGTSTPRTCASCCSSTTTPRRRSRASWATASCASS